jgi:Xaa-Pro aminopeptidase
MILPKKNIQEYKRRRSEIFEHISGNDVALLQGLPQPNGHNLFVQSNNFYYLCGISSPQAYLLLDGKKRTTTLFLMHQSKNYMDNIGDILTPDSDPEALGVDEIKGLEMLAEYLAPVSRIWTPLKEDEGLGVSWDTIRQAQSYAYSDPWDGRPTRSSHFITLLQTRYPDKTILNLNPVLEDLRYIKSPFEQELLRKAGKICAQSVVEAISCIRPGIKEYHLEAVMRYTFLAAGAHDAGYRAIIATGSNAWFGHYSANTSTLKKGELILIDGAPNYHNYTSDIGRMIPVNGTYSSDQRDLYGFVVEYHKALLSCLKPGVTSDQVLAESNTIMMEKVGRMTFSKELYKESVISCLENCKSHLSHTVGMSCHDVGDYRNGEPLQPGMIFAVDPQLLIPQENLRIRVEDTVLITDVGYENLTAGAPLELDEIEQLIRKSGILDKYPPVYQ